jgi:integrase
LAISNSLYISLSPVFLVNMMSEDLLNGDEALNEWLSSLEGRYKQKCRSAFLKFMEFLKEKTGWKEISGDIILSKHAENRKSEEKKTKYFFDDLIPVFILWLQSKGLSHNSAVVQASPVKSFFKYHREPLQVQGRMKFVETRKRFHAYTKDELTRMVQVGDLEEKVVIMLGVQLGIRVGDFVSLKRRPIQEAFKDANGEFPLEFQIETEKEGVISIGHISKDVYDTLQLYWAQAPKSTYVFPSNSGRVFISGDRANDVMKHCWNKAFPERKDAKIRFHELRSYKISALSNAGVNHWHIQKMTGKKVSPDIATYLTGIHLREDFRKAEQAFNLTQSPDKSLEQFEGAIEQLQKENVASKTVAEVMTKKVTHLERELRDALQQRKDLEPLVEFVHSFKSRDELEHFLELFKASSVIRFPEHKMRLVMANLDGGESKRLMITEIFQEVFEELSRHTLSLILKHLETKDDVS